MPAAFDVTTLARLKDGRIPSLSSSTFDNLLTDLIQECSQQFEDYIGHSFLEQTYTELYDIPRGGLTILNLDQMPVQSITSIKMRSSVGSDFADVTALDTTTYDVDLATGEVFFTQAMGWQGRRLVQVVYVAGMGTDQADFEVNYPEVVAAADRQIAWWFARRNMPGGETVMIGGGQTQQTKELTLLSTVKATLNGVRNWSVQ